MKKRLENNIQQKVKRGLAKSFLLGVGLFCVTLFFALDAQCYDWGAGTSTYTPKSGIGAGGTGAKGTGSRGSGTAQPSCQKADCSAATKGCIMKQDSKGHFNQLASNSSMRAACLHERSAKGCFDLTPVSCVGSYGGLGYRPNGAGGNPTPRNHYGSDLGAKSCTRKDGSYPLINVYAAADGKVVYVNTSTGGGRTIAITHTKGCKNAPSGGQYYKSTYRHLLAYKVSAGAQVKRNDIIGLMGGSNAKSIGGAPCDATAQRTDEYKGMWTTAGCGKPYAVHLHFEIEDGAASSSTTQAHAATALDPSCNSLQTLCGGCPSAPGDDSCKGGQQGWSDGRAGTADGTLYPGGAGGGADGGGDYARSQCQYSDYLSNDKCVFCDMFKTMFNAASQIALMADTGLLTPTLNLVKIGFLIWLAIYLLKQLASFNATNSGELTKGILFQGFRVAVVALILSSTASLFYVMDLTLNPVMMTGLNFINDLNTTSTCDKNADYMQNIKGYSSAKGYAGTEKPQGGLSKELGESIVCGIKNLEDSTGMLMKLGNFSVCLGFHDHPWVLADTMGIRIDLPHLGYVTTGIFLWLAGLALLLTFPWCLVDCILQLCIAAALIPCAIGAYAFKITSKYLKIIWDFFMNAMFNFVFMAIIIYIINQQLESWIGVDLGGSENGPDSDHQIFIRFNGLAWYGMGFIRVAAVCFFCYVFFDEAKSMAEKFASSPGLGGGKGIGRMVGGTMMDAAGKTGKAALHTTGKVASAAGAGLNYAVGNQYRSMKNHAIGAIASRFGKNASVTGADGKTIAHEGSFRMFGRDIKFSATKGEDGKWSLTRETHKRSQSDKAFEKVLDKDGNEVRDENGNVKYRARHRVLGKVTGYEDMIATKDEDGNLVYSTADGKSTFRLDENGQIASYKTRFTRSYLGLGKAVEKTKKQYGTNRVVSTPTSRTTERTDALGNVTDAHTEMKDFNLFNRDLVRKDGTINIDTFNEMQKNMANPEQAAKVLVAKVMEARGIKMDLSNPNTTVNIDDNGQVTINQVTKETVREDGKDVEKIVQTKNIQAVMIGDQMFIAAETTDGDGNTTLHESNGIFHTVQTATKQKDGTFQYNFDGGFSEYAMSKNSFMSPVNHKGEWGNNVNRDKAMAGFTQAHFDKYMDQLNVKQMGRTMSTGAYNRSAEAGARYSNIHKGKLESMEEAKQNMTNAEPERQGQRGYQFNDNKGNNPNDDKMPDDLKNKVNNNLNDIQEVRDQLEQEYKTRERLEQEQRELQEKENKSIEEEERIKRELEESQRKTDELRRKQEEAERKKAEIDEEVRKWRELNDNGNSNK